MRHSVTGKSGIHTIDGVFEVKKVLKLHLVKCLFVRILNPEGCNGFQNHLTQV